MAKQRKARGQIPVDVAARILFCSDRTCCVCRKPDRKLLQIHHIDENPCNNSVANLAVLCHECHNETQTKGGFHRKLDSEQVTLYREEWLRLVGRSEFDVPVSTTLGLGDRQRRVRYYNDEERIQQLEADKDFTSLAMIYHELGKPELRDRYIDKALPLEQSFEMELYLRSLQGKTDLISQSKIDAQVRKLPGEKNWSKLGRMYLRLSRWQEAVVAFCEYARDMVNDKPFTAAIYLKEMIEAGVIGRLFEIALADAQRSRDLWWQRRALQELGRYQEADELLIEHADEIQASDDDHLKRVLPGALRRSEQWAKPVLK